MEGGGVLGQYRCEAVLKMEGNVLKYFCERCIQMSFSQWRVAVVVMFISKETTIPLKKKGGSANINSRIFVLPPGNFGREWWDEKYLICRGREMVEDAQISKTSFDNQIADVKGTKWSTIRS